MGLVHFTNSAADGDRSNAANWTDDVPAPLGRVPAAGDAAQMDADSTKGDLTCDSVNVQQYEFFSNPSSTITAVTVSFGKSGSDGTTAAGGNGSPARMAIIGNVVGVDGQTTQAVHLSYTDVTGNVSGYLRLTNLTISGNLSNPGKTSSILVGIAGVVLVTVAGTSTIAMAGTNTTTQFSDNVFNGPATVSLSSVSVGNFNTYHSTAAITLVSTAQMKFCSFGSATTIVADTTSVISDNTFSADTTLTVGSIAVEVDGTGGGAKGRSQGFW